jgi:hypothetical protein
VPDAVITVLAIWIISLVLWVTVQRSSFGQEFLDIAVTQGEAEVQPYCILDDLGRKAMTAVAERSHAIMLSDTPRLPTRFP